MNICHETTFALILVALLSACGDDDTDTAAPGATAEPAAAEPTAEAPEQDEEPDPCALLTEAVIRSTFEVPEGTTIDHPPSRNPVRPVCTYSWEKPNAEEIRAEIQQQQQDRVREMMKQARRGKMGQGMLDMAMDMPKMSNRVSLNYGDASETPEEARSKFDSAMRMMQRGMTQRVEVDEDMPGTTKAVRDRVDGQEITFQADSTPVEGLGDDARWLPRMNELAVLDGNEILFLTVEMDTDRDVNLEQAKRLAEALLD